MAHPLYKGIKNGEEKNILHEEEPMRILPCYILFIIVHKLCTSTCLPTLERERERDYSKTYCSLIIRTTIRCDVILFGFEIEEVL